MGNKKLLESAVQSYDGDIFLYHGDVTRNGYHDLSDLLEKRQLETSKSKKACLILNTFGGDPDAGYRIARALRCHYEELEILVSDICKSAGTLICIGADKLVFGDRGELGPLDIQLSKPDEMFENMSGLALSQAVEAMKEEMLSSFKGYLVDIRGGSRLRTKLAADISVKLSESLISPIVAKIDPITVGEHQRAMQIAVLRGI